MKAHRLIGILGGMGPAATVDFLQKVVAATPARTDQDHIPLVIYDVPQIPSRVDAILTGDDGPYPPMLAGLRVLEGAGAEAIAIVCNTAHFWYDRLAAQTKVPILHIADAVASKLRAAAPIDGLGIAATRGTLAARIYQDRLAAAGHRLILPSEPAQQMIDRTIAAVKAGDQATAAELADSVARLMTESGAKRLLLACTELPVAFAGAPHLARCVDATEALAQACIAFSTAQPHPAERRNEKWIFAGSKTS